MEVYGVKLVGVNTDTGEKILFSLVFDRGVPAAASADRRRDPLVFAGGRWHRTRFWARQGASVFTAVLFTLGFLSIWFDDPKTSRRRSVS